MNRYLRTTILTVLVSAAIGVGNAHSGSLVDISIGFTGTDLNRINLVDGEISAESPGWFVELANRVGDECGHTVTFQQMPWKRLLKKVSTGSVWAATNSSFKLERTEFGQYPMNDGQPDKDRALSRYEYIGIVRKGENVDIINKGIVPGKKYIAELGSSIVPILKKKGALVYEEAKYDQMLRMLVKGRADAIAMIDGVYKDSIGRFPEYRDKVQKARVPLVVRAGYVMFSKRLYQAHSAMIECFWTESARLMKSDWFRKTRDSYGER